MQVLNGLPGWGTTDGVGDWRRGLPDPRGPLVAVVVAAMTVAVAVVVPLDRGTDRARLEQSASAASGAAAAVSAASTGTDLVRNGQTPEGLTADEWTAIQHEIAAARAVDATPGAVASPTSIGAPDVFAGAPRLETADVVARFAAGSAAVASSPSTIGSDVVFNTSRLGDVIARQPAATSIANGVEYQHTADVTEWFRTTPEGLQQGFTIDAPVSATSKFDIIVAVDGGQPRLLDSQTVSIARTGESGLVYRDLIAWDANDVRLPAWMSVDGTDIVLTVGAAGAAYPITVDPTISSSAELLPGALASNDEFGRLGAISENDGRMIVAGQDRAFVFERSGSTWSFAQELVTAGQPIDSVDIDGELAVVGSIAGGSVEVFERDGGGSWTLLQTLATGDATFGAAVGIGDGTTTDLVFTGAPQHGATNRGQIRLYRRTAPAGTFTPAGSGTGLATTDNSFQGAAVDVEHLGDDDFAYGWTLTGGLTWAVVRTVTWTGAALTETDQRVVRSSDAGSPVGFGADLDIEGTGFVIAADAAAGALVYDFDGPVARVGSVGTELFPSATLVPSSGSGALSVARGADTIALGVPGAGAGGQIEIFGYEVDEWGAGESYDPPGYTPAAGDAFGGFVALSGNTLASGAPFVDLTVPGDEGRAFTSEIYGVSTYVGPGQWSSPTSWDTGVVPGTDDTVIVSSGSLPVDGSQSAGRLIVQTGATVVIPSGGGTLTLTGGPTGTGQSVIEAGATLRNEAPTTLNIVTTDLVVDGLLDNQSGEVLSFQGTAAQTVSGTGTIANAGIIRNENPTSVTIDPTLTYTSAATSRIEANVGSLAFDLPVTENGTVAVAAGASVEYGDEFNGTTGTVLEIEINGPSSDPANHGQLLFTDAFAPIAVPDFSTATLKSTLIGYSPSGSDTYPIASCSDCGDISGVVLDIDPFLASVSGTVPGQTINLALPVGASFVEDFSGGSLPARFDNVGSIPPVFGGGVVEFVGVGDSQRSYLRTVETDYASVDFSAEVTVTVPTNPGVDIAFFGLGPAIPLNQFGEPDADYSYRALVWPDNFFPGVSAPGNARNENCGGDGTHRLRLEWTAATQTGRVSIDDDYVGPTFVPDCILAAAVDSTLGLNSTNSRLFIGGNLNITFDDFVVVVDPDSDGDGQLDVDEIACGSNPFDGSSTGPDYNANGIPDCLDPPPGPIVVDTLADTITGGACSLRAAITAANADAASGGCAAGSGADTIVFNPSGVITLGSRLPIITSDITIDGGGPDLTISGGGTSAGIMRIDSGVVDLRNLSIVDSQAQFCPTTPAGGGADNCGSVVNYGTLDVTDVTFSGNNANNGTGAAIASRAGVLTVDSSTFTGNTATYNGAAIWNLATAVVSNSTFADNGSTNNVSTLYNFNSPATTTIYNSTFVAPGSRTLLNASGTLTIHNTIVDGANGDCAGIITADAFSLDTDGTCGDATTTSTAALGLGSLADNGGPTQTVALLAGSSALDAADPGSCPALDQRGEVRPQGSGCDSGAFESDIVVSPPVGLIGHWTFDEASSGTGTGILLDATAGGTDGAILGGAEFVPGVVGSGALSFDGVDDYVDFGLVPELDLVGGDYTISFWTDYDSNSGRGRIINMDENANVSGGYSVFTNELAAPSLCCRSTHNSGAASDTVGNYTTLTPSEWHHVALVYDSAAGERTFFYDGVAQTPFSTPAPLTSDGDDPLLFGAYQAASRATVVSLPTVDVASATIGPEECRPGYPVPNCSALPYGTAANLASPANGSALPAVAKDTISGYPAIHQPQFVNDGFYGNGSSWIGASSNSWVKIDLGCVTTVDSIRFGRDRRGGFDDRDPGRIQFLLALTDDVYANGNDANDAGEYSLAFDSGVGVTVSGTQTLRASFAPRPARYVKVLVQNSGAAIDELEVSGISCGVDTAPAGMGQFFKGSLDEVKLFDVALSPAEVQTLAEAGETAPANKIVSQVAGGNDFGYSVDIDGDWAVVGADGEVDVLHKVGPVEWVHDQTLTDASGAPCCSLAAIDGNRIVVSSAPGGGAVLVFERPDSASPFAEVAEVPVGGFVKALDLDGNRFVVGSTGAQPPATGPLAGRAWVYAGSGATWALEGELLRSDPEAQQAFGASVSISGDVAVASAPLWDVSPGVETSEGAAYVFQWDGVTWSQTDQLFNPDADPTGDQEFGSSVAIDGNVLAVGQRLDNGALGNAGAAYVYQGAPGAWGAPTQLLASDAATSDEFGFDVDVAANRVIVGAWNAEGSSPAIRVGAAYVYDIEQVAGAWTESAVLRAADGATIDRFGWSVAIDGVAVLVGAPFDDNSNGVDAGAAYSFAVSPPPPANKVLAPFDSNEFATAVDVSGDTAVVAEIGLPGETSALYVLERNALSGVWSITQTESFSGPPFNSGVVDIAVHGNVMAAVADTGEVGIWERTGPGNPFVASPVTAGLSEMGSVDTDGTGVFAAGPQGGSLWTKDVGGTWQPANSTGEASVDHGADVAIDGSVIVVSVNDAVAVTDGVVYVYDRAGSMWTGPTDTLSAPAGSSTDGYFGSSVAVQGSTLVIGQDLEDNDAGDPRGVQGDAGAAWVYSGLPGAWGPPVKLVPGDNDTANRFGSSVAIDGASIVVGAAGAEELGVPTRNGAAYLYQQTPGGLWVEADTLRADDGQDESLFGADVGVSGNNVIVGAPFDDNANGVDAGAAYVYDILIPDNPTLSFSLAVGAGQTPPTIANDAGIPISQISGATPLIESKSTSSGGVGSTALDATGVSESALRGTLLGETPFGAIAVSNEELAGLPILSIGLDLPNEDDWPQILATTEFADRPIVNVTVGEVFEAADLDQQLKAKVDAIPFGAIDVGGTPFGAIPFGAIALGGVPLTLIPPGPDVPDVEAAWCDILDGTSKQCVAGSLDPDETLMSISLSDVPFGAIPFREIPFGAIPVEQAPFGAIELNSVQLEDTPFGAIPFGAIEFGPTDINASPFGAIPFGAISPEEIPFGAIDIETVGVDGIPFGAILLEDLPFGAIPFGAIEVNGAPFGAIPYGAIALAEVNLVDIPLDPERTTTAEIEADWCALMGEFGLDCTNGATTVSNTTITDLGVRGLPFGAIPFGAIYLDDLPFGAIAPEDIPFGAIALADVPFGAINLNAVDIDQISLEGTPFGAIPFGAISPTIGAIPFGAIDVQGSPFGAILLEDLPFGAIGTEPIPFGAIPFGAIGPEGLPFGAIPYGAIPFGAIGPGGTVGEIPFGAIDLVDSPFGAIPIDTLPFGAIGSIVDCDLVDCESNASLRDAFLAGAILPGATLGDLGDAAANLRLPDLAEHLLGIPAQELYDAVFLWGDGMVLTDLTDFANMTLGDLPVDHALFRQTVLNDIKAGLSTVSFEELALALLLTSVADPVGELETVVDGFGAALTLADFDTFGDTTFSELLPAFGGSALGELGAFLAFVHLGDLGFTPEQITAALETNGTGPGDAWLVSDAINAGLGLGDMKLADIVGSTEWGAATVLDLVNSLPPDEVAGFTFSDLLLGMLPPGALPWGLAFEKIDAESIPGVMPPITLQSDFSLTGTRSRSVEVSVELPTNAAYLPGSTQVTPAVGGDLEPNEVDGRLVWTFSGVTPGPDSVTPGQSYTMTFDVQPTLSIGSTAVNADSRVVGAPGSVSSTTLLQVLEAFEPNDVLAEAEPVAEDVVYLTHISDENDIDLFSVEVLENDRLAVDLSGLPADFDVVLYRETTAPGGTEALSRSILAEPLVPVLDPDADSSETVPDQSFPRLDLTEPSLSMVAISNSRGLAKETIVTDRLEAGRYIIQVHGHDGASSPEPSVLQINVIEAGTVPVCVARGPFAATPTPGAALNVANLPADLDTVILINEMRFEQIYGSTGRTDVTTALADLVAAMGNDPEISTLGLSAAVVAVDGAQAVRDAYAFWDDPAIAEDACNPETANDVVSTIIEEILDPIRDARDIENIVLVGSDDLLPFGRLADATEVANEYDYRNDLTGRNAFTGSFWASTFLSDDPYAETGALPFGDRFLYVPDAALGRVLETPDQIVAQVEQFITFDGFLAADSGLIAGYDFLVDGSEAIANELQQNAAVPLVDDVLADGFNAAGEAWTATDIEAALLNVPAGENEFDLVSFNAHFDHYRALPAAGDKVPNFNDNFESSVITGLTLDDQRLDGTIIFSMGCHSGLNVPNTTTNNNVGVTGVAEDWAEVFTEQRAVYIGNTGFGYGDTETVGYTERLMQLFARNVASPVADDIFDASTVTTIGDAMRYAKQEVFSELNDVSVYHEKAYQESTFYGLPFFRVGVAPVLKQAPPDNQPEVEELTGTPAAAYVAEPQNSPNVVETVDEGGVVVKTETFYSNLNGAGDPVTITQPGRPIQPGISIDVTDVDPADPTRLERQALGAIILDMTSTYIEVDPVLSVPVFDQSSQAPEPDRDDIVYPTVPGRITTFERPEGARQNLVLATGQYRGSETTGVQRLDDDLDVVVYYAAPTETDRTAPRILRVDTSLDGAELSVTAQVEDATGVDRVYVLVTATPNQPQAEWVGIDLTDLGGGQWAGGYTFASAPLEIELLAQAKDEPGNIGVSTNKARNFGDESVPPPPVTTLTTTLTADPGGPIVNGYYTGPVTVTADAGGTPIQYRLNNSGVPLDLDLVGGLVVSGDRSHSIEIIAIDGQRTTRTFKIDTSPPTATISKPVVGASYLVGQTVKSSFQCLDGSGATCTGVVTKDATTVATITSGQNLPTAIPGTYELTVTATDPVGNTRTAVRSYTVVANLDVTITPAVGTSWFDDTYDGPVSVSASAGSQTVTYAVNGSESGEVPVGGIDVTADGEYVFVFTAGSQAETVSFTIDATGPEVTITSPAGESVLVGDEGVSAVFGCSDVLSEPSTCTASLSGPETIAVVVDGDGLPTMEPGVYTLTVVGTDAVENETAVEASYTVLALLETEVVPAVGTSWFDDTYDGPVSVSASAGSQTVTYAVNGSESGEVPVGGIDVTADGEYVFVFTAGSQAETVSFTIDATGPEVTITSPAGESVLVGDEGVSAVFGCSDVLSEPSTCTASLSGPETIAVVVDGDGLPTMEPGVYTLTVVGTDAVENETAVEASYTVLALLETEVTPAVGTSWFDDTYDGPVSVSASAGSQTVTYAVNGSESGEVPVGGIDVTADGEYVFVFTAGSQAETVSFTIDATGPEVTITSPAGESVLVGDEGVSAVFGCSDVLSEPSTCTASLSGPETIAVVVDGDGLPTMEPGVYTLTVVGTDAVENETAVEASYTVLALLETEVTPAVGTSWFDDTYDGPVSVSASAGSQTVTYAVNGSESGEVPVGGIDVTADGEYVFVFTAGSQAETVSFTIDATGPEVTITSPADDRVPVDQVGLSADFGCGDALSEPSTCTALLIGPGTAITLEPGDALPTATPGIYTLTATGTDAVGNKTDETAMYTVSSPPEVLAIRVPATPQLISDGVDVDVDFTDADGPAETYRITIDYGDADPNDPLSVSTTCTVSTEAPVVAGGGTGVPSCALTQSPDQETGAVGTVTSQFVYPRNGVFVITVTVEDSAGNPVEVRSDDFVVVYDPGAGRVSGSGKFWSADSSYVDADTEGEWAHFGYKARYKSQDSIPDGDTKLKLKGNFKFTSTSYDYLIINDTMAVAEGLGEIDEVGGFRFRVQGIDNGSTDFFQITIWEDADPENVIYDNGVIFDENGNSDGDEVLTGGIKIKP